MNCGLVLFIKVAVIAATKIAPHQRAVEQAFEKKRGRDTVRKRKQKLE